MAKDESKDKKSSKIEHNIGDRDVLAKELLDIVNTASKDKGNVAFFLDQEDDPSQITDWISTGNSELDLAISNRPNGGLPVGRIVELTGLEAAGKSLIAAHVLAETQRKGGLAIFIDTETAVSREFMEAIGIDVGKMLYITHDTIEDIFDTVENLILKIRKSGNKRIVTIVIDSIAAASSKAEMEQDHGAAGYATQKAIGISKAMRKITNLMGKERVLLLCTNQLRQKVGFVGAGDPYTTSGGKALGFHASVRIRLKSTGRINNSNKEVVGIKTKAIVTKNRMGPPFRSAEFNIFFDRGIDNYGNWIERLIDYDIITPYKPDKVGEDGKKKTKVQLAAEKEASKKDKILKFDMFAEDGTTLIESVQFEKKDFLRLISERPEVKAYLYGKLCDKFIFKYSDPKASASDEIEISDADDSED